MKKALFVASLLCAMVVFSATTAVAQQGIKNATSCAMTVKLAYGNPFTCTSSGSLVYTLPAMTSIFPLPFVAPDQIIAAKGADAGFTCPVWYVGLACSGYPLGQGVVCPTCGDYKVKLLPQGIHIYQ